jgi:hypothetical protein
MGNNSYILVLCRGTAIFALNGKGLLVRNVLHVSGLAVPLYSLCTHFTQRGCGFLGTKESGFLVYFPTFVLSVDTAVDCHLSFDTLSHSSLLHTLHYIQPRCPPSTYPSEFSPTLSVATPSPDSPAVVDDDKDNVPHSCVAVPPIQFSSTTSNNIDMIALSTHLKDLADTVHCLTLPPPQPPQSSSILLPSNPDVNQPSDTSTTADEPVTCLLSTMTPEEITYHLHHPGTSFPLVRPCNTTNASDTKTHWSAEKLHRIMGCCKFRNYKHLLQVSRDGQWINGDKFPFSLGSYATIPKAKQGSLIGRTKYYYLDAVHMDIMFGDCVAVGGYHYSLVVVDRTTHYNWTFGLKSFSSEDIIYALRFFQAAAGLLARCFYSDCDLKLFGLAVSKYFIDGQSKVVAALAKHQSANGLVESHWKVMVHMARAYLTEKQMPCMFWFYAITHAARMMNAIPGKYSGQLASPFLRSLLSPGYTHLP